MRLPVVRHPYEVDFPASEVSPSTVSCASLLISSIPVNEAAVAAFLCGKIGFYDITDVVRHSMETAVYIKSPDLDTIFRINEETLAKADETINRI